MKKKFISVAMFCALIASSPVWVGCSDYDDDIANLQSQVDALKQTVDVSTAEALKALQEAQAALQEDINELTAGKADAQAVKDLQETVAALQTAITENDITKIGELSSQVSELIAQVNGIEGDLDKTQSDLQQQKTELEGKVNSLRADLEKAIADKADQATVDSIKSELDTAVTNLTDVENRLVEVEKWIKNNGQELAKLTANVSQINNLIAKISEEAATTISDPATYHPATTNRQGNGSRKHPLPSSRPRRMEEHYRDRITDRHGIQQLCRHLPRHQRAARSIDGQRQRNSGRRPERPGLG